MSIRFRPLPTHLALLALIVVAACGQSPPADPPATASPLEGVWSMTASDPGDGSPLIDPSQAGLYIFAEGYYSGVYAPGPDPRVPSETMFQPTPDEMLVQYETIIVNTGTYEISGSTVTFRPIIAKSPGFVGGQATAEFQVEGETLTLTFQTIVATDGTSAPDVEGSLTFRRVE